MLRLVDEHRAQRVCNGTYIAAQQLGDSKADVGDVGQQQQCNEHAQVERQGGLDHLFQMKNRRFDGASPQNRFKIADASWNSSNPPRGIPVRVQKPRRTWTIRKDRGLSNTPTSTRRITTPITYFS